MRQAKNKAAAKAVRDDINLVAVSRQDPAA